MRIAVISDVHGNDHALDAVLDEVDAASPDAIWCLGDVVGYGPAPNRCCKVVAERADLSLVGNHDLVVLGELDVADFNEEAAAAALWTRNELDDRSREFLAALEPTARTDGVELFHASPRDPVWEYVLSAETAYAGLQATTEPLVLVGHSHVALAIGLEDDELQGGLAPAGTSRATGIRAQPGCSSTPMRARRRSTASSTTLRRRRRRSASRGCRRRSPSGWRTASRF